MFKQAATYNNTTDLQEYSETVTAYITKCIDDVTVTKTITVRANQKPWLTGEVYRLLKARNAAFRAGDEEGLKTARANLSRGIREAKRQYTGAPQGCVLSPLLFTLLTHDCTPSHNSNLFIKFADDTTVVGLISNRDETNYRSEVSRLAGWCSDNNLSLNVEKTKEIVVDFRRVHTQHAPLTINGATVERASSTKFLGVHITEGPLLDQQHCSTGQESTTASLLPPQTQKSQSPDPIICTFYRGTIESILTSCITVWYGACNASCRKSLQQIVRAAEKIVGVSLPSLQDIYSTRLTAKPSALQVIPHPPDTHLLQSAAIREETVESPGQDQQTEGQLHPSGCQEAELPPVLAPLPSLTLRTTETLTPPHHHHHHHHHYSHTHTLTHTLTHTHTHTL